ncbi:MAG TPA: glycosyltransferase family 4 protein [Ignavibacteria bacterium]
MRILYILPYDWGAMPQYTAEIANAVSNYEEVIVLGSVGVNTAYFSNNVKVIKCFDSFSFSMNNFRKSFSLSTIKALLSFKDLKIINEINPDIIHLTTPVIPPLSIYISYFGLDKKYPLIYTKHGVFSNSGFKEKILEEYILGYFEKILKFSKIVVHTNKDKEELVDIKKYNEKNIVIIPHGIYTFFRKFEANSLEEQNCILFFGNIREYKGLRYLIEAVPFILSEIPDLKVIIAGEGDISEFSSVIEKYKNVYEIHNEFVSDEKVAELFQRSSTIVMPYTKMSGQSGILNVALAFNKPMVASDVGSIKDVVVNGVTGFLVPPNDTHALARATITILKNSQLRQEMEINLKEKYKNLSWDNIAKKHIELYSTMRTKSR